MDVTDGYVILRVPRVIPVVFGDNSVTAAISLLSCLGGLHGNPQAFIIDVAIHAQNMVYVRL